MSNKLQNIKAVREMLDGTHKTQTRQAFGFSDAASVAKKNAKHEVGDVWEETSPNGTVYEVTQHEGFRSRKPKNSIIDTIKEALKVPDHCPECGGEMRGPEQRLNFKFYFKRKKCFGCVLAEERRIKAQGPEAWKKYENDIMLANAEAWFRDTDKEVEVLKSQVKETFWQNADGNFGEIDITSFVEKMEKDYEELKADIRKQLE